MKVIANKQYVLNKLAVFDVKAEKKYGQNFLVDEKIAHAIVSQLELEPTDEVIEIGPGLGALSQILCEYDNSISLVEIDPVMVEHLQKELIHDKLKVVHEDFLKYNLTLHNQNLKVVGNLPYYITTAIIEKLIIEGKNIQKMVLMIQKEAYQRLVAKCGTKEYGPMAIFIEYLGGAKVAFNVSRHAYLPEPHVDSLVFTIKTNKKTFAKNENKFFEMTKALFLNRRKTILNNLTSYLNSKEKAQYLLGELNVDFNKRPEQLTLDFYLKLADSLS